MDIVRTERTAHDLAAEQAQWQTWIDAVCADVEAIHDLSRQVAHGLARPLAPVSTFILGLALGRALGSSGAAVSGSADGSAESDGSGSSDGRTTAEHRAALSDRIAAHI